MKKRNGFISNSSSTSFIITNTSDKEKTLVDFVEENPQIIEDWKSQYDYTDDKYNQGALTVSASKEVIIFAPGERKQCIFGDEQGTLIGRVFDYMLRAGGSSESFEWHFDEYYR